MKLTKIAETEGLTLTIDPGINGTGLALWRNSEWDRLAYPIVCENIAPKEKGSWGNRAKDLCDELRAFIETYNIDYSLDEDLENGDYLITNAIIEEPKYFADSAFGDMAAKTNSLGKLYMLVGLFMGVLWNNEVGVELARVDHWKGSLTKEAVIKRIRKKLPEIDKRLNPKTHSFDAIGIGLAAKGFLTERQRK